MSTSPSTGPSTGPSSGIAAELSVTAEHVERYRERIAALAQPLLDGRHEDAVATMFEAERSLRTAHRLLDRASAMLRG
jgi:hypothetical protein